MTRIQVIIFFTTLIVLGLQNCSVGSTKTLKDEHIEQGVKNEIEILDKKVIEAVATNNVDLLKSIMSDVLLEKSGNNIDTLLKQVSPAFTSTDYEILNQYQTKNSVTGLGNTIISGISGLNDYILQYQALNKEMFASLLIFKSGLDEILITNIYGKNPEGWRLNILQFGQYKINGQTAAELYSKAKEEYEKGYLVDAVNDMSLCSRVVKPANKFWQYQKENEMEEFYEKVIKEITSKYKFPITLEAIDSKPQIIRVYPQGAIDGYFPMLEYVTKLDLKDTAQTKAEYEKVHAEVVKLFYGIDKDKDYIFYKALSEMPKGDTPVPAYGFVRELKE